MPLIFRQNERESREGRKIDKMIEIIGNKSFFIFPYFPIVLPSYCYYCSFPPPIHLLGFSFLYMSVYKYRKKGEKLSNFCIILLLCVGYHAVVVVVVVGLWDLCPTQFKNLYQLFFLLPTPSMSITVFVLFL